MRLLLTSLLITSLLSVFVLFKYAQKSVHDLELAQSLSMMTSALGFTQDIDAHHQTQIQHISRTKGRNLDRSNSESQTGFQRVGDTLNTYVYSAIYDDIEVPIIRVIALVRHIQDARKLPSFVCTYFNGSGQASPVTYRGILQYMQKPNLGYRYHSGFIKCGFPKDGWPTAVRISGIITTKACNMLRVIYPLKKKRQLTRCFSALHSNFSNTLQLIQTLEISLMFGVEHFIVYNYSIHESAMNVLKHYRNLGVLEILPWDVPLNRSEIYYFAQLAVIQECMYRNLHVSEFILTGDTDEVYIPKVYANTLDMIVDNLKGRPSCSCLLVRNTFFPVNLQPHTGNFTLKQEARRLNLTYLLYTSHLIINNPGKRSKVIIKPTGVEIVGTHTVKKFRKGHNGCICQYSRCLLHHYRIVPPKEWGSVRATDDTLLKYSEKIVQRVIERITQLNLDKQTGTFKV
ncbi:uncharacterized protein LOC124148619 [Haliotis rufescens]|uniref:uncharacterized protein LOC124148619 n=1 Tax=Haliotis rufescens TaxID=6454 RepID=UPI001EB0A592|nr:uncharacterized protein LOC124148619 [Haliotis rufescens]